MLTLPVLLYHFFTIANNNETELKTTVNVQSKVTKSHGLFGCVVVRTLNSRLNSY